MNETRWLVMEFIDASPLPNGHVYENMAGEGRYILGCDCSVFDSEHHNCPHIQYVISRREDGKAWTKHQHPDAVFVPVFPEFGVMVDMFRLEDSEMWSIHIHMKGATPDSYNITESIGFVGLGEGRRDIRNLVVEWLHAQYQLVPPCESQAHTRLPFSKHEKKRILDASNVKVARDVYNLLSEGICYDCRELGRAGIPEV